MGNYQLLHDALDQLLAEMTAKGVPQETVGIMVDGVPIVIMTVTLNVSPESLETLHRIETVQGSLPDTLPEDIDRQMRDLKPNETTELDQP